ncbi:hypothetical protein NFI96_029582, partial [Prochilodus magdalenae]
QTHLLQPSACTHAVQSVCRDLSKDFIAGAGVRSTASFILDFQNTWVYSSRLASPPPGHLEDLKTENLTSQFHSP